MIGDVINLEQKHLDTAENIYEKIKKTFQVSQKWIVGIGGESGSGKSVTAFALRKILEEKGITGLVIQMDDYFKLPPKSNHENRQKSLNNVGLHEVYLDKIQETIKNFKENESFITKPLIHYAENSVSEEILNIEDIQVLIIEGTYVLDIDDFDVSIFIDRTYKDTYENRMKRNRDEQSDFVEKVLEIEHKIIRQFKEKADLLLDKEYHIIESKL
ncbi:uridine kinase family protein [Chryseobacterium sp. 'Rf worker isolate 10']|uniref:uridine kinase family protein n=1 Tax=Chryseobacterium sp. 'Rf worker isolate 10' TaxID=2887348 RepID=UPI003D6E79CD